MRASQAGVARTHVEQFDDIANCRRVEDAESGKVSGQQVFKAVPLFEIKLIPECFGLEAIRK